MSKSSNPIPFFLIFFSISYLPILGIHGAAAQYVTSLGQPPSQVRLCPSRECFQIFEHSFFQGKKIVIYEKRNGWVRLSRPIAREQLQAKFTGEKIPANAAYWIPSADLPPAIAMQFHSEKIEPEADKKPKPIVFAKLPQIAPLPTSRPGRQVSVKTETKSPKIEPIVKPKVVENQPEPQISEPETTKVENTEVKLAATETNSEPEEETDIFGNPVVKLPSKLTKELKDKRLSKLPRKPKSGLDLKSIIAIRYHGLRLLNDGSCKAIQKGGRSLSLAGWIYVICEDDGQYRQFSVE